MAINPQQRCARMVGKLRLEDPNGVRAKGASKDAGLGPQRPGGFVCYCPGVAFVCRAVGIGALTALAFAACGCGPSHALPGVGE
jgi:hypothetical protein